MTESIDFLIPLAEQVQAGDIAALEELLYCFQPLIKKWVAKAPLTEREDLQQELLILVIKGILSFRIHEEDTS